MSKRAETPFPVNRPPENRLPDVGRWDRTGGLRQLRTADAYLLRADLCVEYREFEGGLVEYVLRPMLENRILRGGTIGANLAA